MTLLAGPTKSLSSTNNPSRNREHITSLDGWAVGIDDGWLLGCALGCALGWLDGTDDCRT
jgi:hypothetical protein